MIEINPDINNKNINFYIDPVKFKNILLKSTLLPIILSILICVLFIQQFARINSQNNLIHQSDILLTNTLGLTKTIIDSETGFRGFLLTGKEEFLEPFNSALSHYYPAVDNLRLNTKNNPAKNSSVNDIAKNYESWLASSKTSIDERRKSSEVEPLENFTRRKMLMDNIRLKLDGLYAVGLNDREQNQLQAQEIAKQALGLITTLGVLVGSLLAFFSFRQLSQLSQNYNLVIMSLTEASENLEEKIAARTQDLIAVNNELEAFSYSVSHDLRAPLRGIDGFSQILVEEYAEKLDGEALRYLNFIRQGVQKMGHLIDDLINLSRMTRSEFKSMKTDISVLAEEVMSDLVLTNPKRKLIFKNFDPEFVLADPGLLKIALQNLLSNSWKYSQTREETKIELGKMTLENKSVYFIKDNGVGFDMRYADKLFQPFQRLHAKDTFSGTGIGLAIVGRVIKRHGGKIWAKSTEGVGSIFYFTLFNKEENP